MELIEECFERAVDVLRENSTEFGFKASRERYNSIWARDGATACLGSISTGEDDLLRTSVRTLSYLRDLQSPLGQIPNFVDLRSEQVNFYASDATAWWIIASAALWREKGSGAFPGSFWPALTRAITWLRYQSVDGSGLISSPPAAVNPNA